MTLDETSVSSPSFLSRLDRLQCQRVGLLTFASNIQYWAPLPTLDTSVRGRIIPPLLDEVVGKEVISQVIHNERHSEKDSYLIYSSDKSE